MVDAFGVVADEVSHAEIYRRLGELQGTVNALVLSIGERREDLKSALSKVDQLEQKQSWMLGACAVIGILLPLVVTISAMRVEFGQEHQPIDQVK